MAIKYKRPESAPARDVYWSIPRLRPRLVYIYAGLSFVAAILIIYFAVAGSDTREQPAPEAVATVIEKTMGPADDGDPRFRVVLEAQMPNGDRIETSVNTDELSWSALLPGDEVVITYGRPLVSGGLHVQSMRPRDQ